MTTPSAGRDDDPLARVRSGGAWAGLRDGRWGVPGAAVVAVLVLVAAVAVALVLRAAATLPTTDFEAATAGPGEPSGSAQPTGTAADDPAGRGPPGASVSAADASAPGATTGAAPSPAAGSAPVVVHVVGQVRDPGLVEVPAGSRVADAVEAAGGLTGEADPAALNLARPVVDGEQLLVPRPGEAVPAPAGAPVPAAGAPTAPGAPAGPVPLNTATPAELDALPGIGPVLAARIVEWREANGGFRSVEELSEVSGIGDAVLEQVRPLVAV
jgi:competence protein ComEA